VKKPVTDKPEVFTFEQGTAEWFEARRGIPTASMFSTVMASGKGGGESKTRRKYLLELAGEILTEEAAPEKYSNASMERGKEMEAVARNQYAFQTDAELERVGFIKCGRKGCSPDSLIGKKKMLEIKTTLPHLLIDIHLRGEFPPEHKAQCQGNLWVAGREEIDIAIYWPKMPLYVQTIHRDEVYIAALASAVDEFNNELAYVVQQMRKLG
jgi:hypothetical protein